MANIPKGLKLVGPEPAPLPEGAKPLPKGLILQETEQQKKAREFQHKAFVPGISDETFEQIKERAPAAAGGIGFGIASGGSGFLVGAGMSALGGAFGEGMKDLYNFFYDPAKAPAGDKERLMSMAVASGEEAVADMGGRIIGGVLGKGYHIFRPKVKGGVHELQKAFSQFKGSFTQAQRSDAWLVQQTDSIVRGSLTGRGIMHQADALNEAALNVWREDLSQQIAKGARINMSNSDFGSLLSDTLGNGRAAFKTYIGDLYGNFDELVKTKVKTEFVKKFDIDTAGNIIEQTEKMVNEFRPVDVRGLKESAAQLSLRLKKAGDLGRSDFGGTTIERLLKLDDALKFSTAQEVRSTLLDLSRAAKLSGDSKLSGSLTHFSSQMTKAMDAAAKRQGLVTQAKYARIKREAEKGYSQFNSKLVHNILKDDANLSKVADDLFKDGNADKVFQLRKTLVESAKHDKRINVNDTMNQVKQKYLEFVLNKSTNQIPMDALDSVASFEGKAGVPSATRLAEFFKPGHKRGTMNALLSQSEQANLFKFGQALQLTQASNDASLGMVMQLTQAGVVMQAATGREGAARQAAGLLLPTRLLAHMMSNPTAVKVLTAAVKTPVWAKQAPVVATKLRLLVDNAKADVEGRNTLSDDVNEYIKGVSQNVFDGGRRVTEDLVDRFVPQTPAQPQQQGTQEKGAALFGPFDKVFGGS